MTCAIAPIFKRRLLGQFYRTRSAVAKPVTVRMDVVFEAAVIKEAAFDKLFEKKTATLAVRRPIPDRANAESLLHCFEARSNSSTISEGLSGSGVRCEYP